MRERHLGRLETEKDGRVDCHSHISAEMDYSYFRFTSIPHFVGFTRSFLRVHALGRFRPEQVVKLQSDIPKGVWLRKTGDL